MSDFSHNRALRAGLLRDMPDIDKEEFKEEVQRQLGLEPGQDCDSICGAMDDRAFERFIEYVKEILRRKKSKMVAQPIYA